MSTLIELWQCWRNSKEPVRACIFENFKIIHQKIDKKIKKISISLFTVQANAANNQMEKLNQYLSLMHSLDEQNQRKFTFDMEKYEKNKQRAKLDISFLSYRKLS